MKIAISPMKQTMSMALMWSVLLVLLVHGEDLTEIPRTEGVHLLPGTVVVAVASCSLSGGSVTDAEATAEQRARKQIAEFIGCIVEGRTEESLRMLARDSADGATREAEESFIQTARSSARAFLQGMRRVAAWRNDAGDMVCVAVRCAPHEAAGFTTPQAPLTAPTQMRAEAAASDVIVEGFAEYHAGNLAGTREKAIRDALRRAVAMVAGVVLDTQTMSADRRVQERIVSQSDGYVSSYAILAEELTDDQRYRVRVWARVNTGKVRDNVQAMRALHSQLNNPKVMCLFVETLNGQRVANSRLVNVLENMLRDQGIEVVDQAQVLAAMADLDKDYYTQCVRDDNRAAEFGHTHGAEVIIVGDNTLHHLGRDPDGVFEQVPHS